MAGVVAAAGEGVIDGVWMRRRWVPSEDVDVAVSAEPLTLEAAELQEKFQWLTEEQSRRLAGQALEAVKEELADVFVYTLRMAQVLGVTKYDRL